jgi:ABC-type phosphate transport system auxiliary subunit
MRSMSATAFARNFAQIFAEFESLRAKARRSLLVGNLSDETVKALKKTKMDKRHAALNALMQD